MSRVVYVGHVPFDMTEEQIEDIFRSAGPVQQTRLVFDRATGKSKGFAFVQYFDPESAASAVRNLDNHKVGSMYLRVNYSSGRFPDGKSGRQDADGPSNPGGPGGPGKNGPANNTQNDEAGGVIPEIVDTVSRMSVNEKREMLVELKNLIAEQPATAQQVLESHPQAAYAVVQSLFELGLIDGSHTEALIVDTPTAQPERQDRPERQERQERPDRRRRQTPQHTPQPSHTPQQTPQPSHTPQQTPQPQHAPIMLNEEQKQWYRQVMALSNEQLDAMPAEHKQAALQMRAQVESGAVVV